LQPENIVDTGKLLRQLSDESAEAIEKSRPRFNPEQYRVERPRRLARPSEYSKGGKVKRTGWAKVHKGERILRAAQVLGRKRRKKKRKTR